jgi:hypothetical protein
LPLLVTGIVNELTYTDLVSFIVVVLVSFSTQLFFLGEAPVILPLLPLNFF